MKKGGVGVESLSMYKDPFVLLGMEPTFVLDYSVLDTNYFALQRQWHPDNFARKSPEEQHLAQKQATEVNQAYGILKDPIERAKALIVGMGGKEEPDQTPALLTQAFDWQNRLESADSTLLADLQQERTQLEGLFQKAFVEKNQQAMQETYGLLVYCLKTLEKIHV
jgi:molecular chaperone HscB